MKSRAARPSVEVLENRWVPALLLSLDAAGNLTTIHGVPSGPITLLVTSTDEVNVNENGTDLGTYSVPGNLNVSVGNSTLGPLVLLDLNGNSLSGSVSMSVGNDPIGYALFVEGAGSIGGDLRLSMGTSAVGLGQMGVATGIFDPGDMEIGGNLTMTTTARIADIFLGFDGNGSHVTVHGNVTARGGDEFGVGSANSIVEGNLTYVSSPAAPTVGHQMRLETGSVVDGNVSFTGSNAGGDQILFGGNILGNAIVNMGTGANDFTMNGVIGGSLTFIAGTGVTNVNLAAAGTILGNVTVMTGNAIDTINLGGTVGGSSIMVNTGGGNDVVNVANLSAAGARLTALLGNGNDTLNFAAATTTLASAYLDGGLGVDAFNVTGVIAFPLILRNF